MSVPDHVTRENIREPVIRAGELLLTSKAGAAVVGTLQVTEVR